MEIERLQGEVICLVVEDGDSSEMRDRRCGRRNPVTYQLPGVDPPREICLLKYNKVHIHL